jgi:hypothetical protein
MTVCCLVQRKQRSLGIVDLYMRVVGQLVYTVHYKDCTQTIDLKGQMLALSEAVIQDLVCLPQAKLVECEVASIMCATCVLPSVFCRIHLLIRWFCRAKFPLGPVDHAPP